MALVSGRKVEKNGSRHWTYLSGAERGLEDPRYFVVDDKSHDRTVEITEEMRIELEV